MYPNLHPGGDGNFLEYATVYNLYNNKIERKLMTGNDREIDIRTVNVTRYIMPLREGGSLPALAEADDGFKYVVKFRGAGHGTKALIADRKSVV